jgi:hypothetical protein
MDARAADWEPDVSSARLPAKASHFCGCFEHALATVFSSPQAGRLRLVSQLTFLTFFVLSVSFPCEHKLTREGFWGASPTNPGPSFQGPRSR